MLFGKRWQQTPYFEPANTGQMIQEHYTGLPGGYSSFYFNQVPLNAALNGLGFGGGWLSNLTWLGIAAGAVAGGYYGWTRGRKKGLKGLRGARNRRRRRR